MSRMSRMSRGSCRHFFQTIEIYVTHVTWFTWVTRVQKSKPFICHACHALSENQNLCHACHAGHMGHMGQKIPGMSCMSHMSRISQGFCVGIFGQKYKNHVTGTRNTRMSHLAVLNPIMSHIYLKTWISGPQENIHCSISGVLQPLADWAERPPPWYVLLLDRQFCNSAHFYFQMYHSPRAVKLKVIFWPLWPLQSEYGIHEKSQLIAVFLFPNLLFPACYLSENLQKWTFPFPNVLFMTHCCKSERWVC